MNLKFIAVAFVFVSVTMTFCKSDSLPCPEYPDCTQDIYIAQGVAGSCIMQTGDWFPMPDHGCYEWSTQERMIYFFEPTVDSQVVGSVPGSAYYEQVNSTLLGQTSCDANGCYQIFLPPGVYSVFIDFDGQYYCSSRGGVLCAVTIDSGAVTMRDLFIDRAFH